jgi:hypothetical protein
MKHDVHAFCLVRVKRAGIDADNHDDAVEKAMEQFQDFYDLFNTRNIRTLPDGVIDVEFGEEFSHFLVDEKGDQEFARSTWHEGKGVELPGADREESPSVIRLATRLAAYIEDSDTATLTDLGETVFGVADPDVREVAMEAARGNGGKR